MLQFCGIPITPTLSFRETQKVAAARGIQLQSLEVRQPNDFDRAFKALRPPSHRKR